MERRRIKIAKADCPACFGKVDLGPKPKLGQRIVCPACRAKLEVIEVEPVELDLAGLEEKYEDDDLDL